MFFKKKCPTCGAKNLEENISCSTCGTLFPSENSVKDTGAAKNKIIKEKHQKQLQDVKTTALNLDETFLMHVDDVFQPRGRGTVITGLVQKGIIRRNDTVRIAGNLGYRSDVVKHIEKFSMKQYSDKYPGGIRRTMGYVKEALSGDYVGLELSNRKADDVEHGDVIETIYA